MTHRLSILLPVYNGEKYLDTALKSLLGSPVLENAEVLAVDDGSTDTSPDILQSYIDKLPLRILTPERTGNWALNTNRAAQEARGTYLCFLHQDDLWLPNRGAWIKETLSGDSPPDIFFSSAVFLNPEGRKVGTWSVPFRKTTAGTLGALDWLGPLLVQNSLAIGAPVFRRDRYLEFGGLDPELTYTADWKLWLRFACHCQSIYTHRPTVGFRIHPESQTVSMSEFTDNYRRQMTRVFETYAENLPSDREEPLWREAGKLSLEMNCLLAAGFHGSASPFRKLLSLLLRTPPSIFVRYIHYSRVFQRVRPRLFLKKSAT